VGSWCVVGCRAMFMAVISLSVGWVGGSDSCDGLPSISVSLWGAGSSRVVFLVFGAILVLYVVSTKKQEPKNIDLEVLYTSYNMNVIYT